MNKPRLFIVEDEAIVAADIAIRLAQLGYEVAGTATSGEEALSLLDQIRPDLVLMDIRLQGGMDGIVAAQEVRQRFHLPVIFLTAYAEGATFQRAKLAEPFGYILKPFEDRELEIVIDLALYKHQAERRIQQIEQRHKTLIKTSMDGFWMLDEQGHLLEVNETYCRMSGYSMPELLAMRVSDLDASETAEHTAAHIGHIQTQGVDRFESKHRRKDGSLFEVEVSVLYQTEDGGCMVAFIRDISERKQAAAFLQLVLSNIPDFVFWKDRNSVYLGCNNHFAEVAGVGTPDKLIGKTDYDMGWKLEESNAYIAMDRQVMERDQAVYHIIEPQRQASGKQAWLDTCKVPLHDEQGQVIGLLGTYMDVTERKLAEQRLRQSEAEIQALNSQLEQRVIERTAQLEAANKELEAFSYSVSHDLRAPLRAVDGYTRMLLDDYAPRLDAEGQRICTTISQSAKNMGKLIDDLLAFSRVGRSALQLMTLDMEALVQAIFAEVSTPEDRARIDFEVGPLPDTVADPTLLRQLWVNLLSNAVKFSSKKPRAVIQVTAEAGEHGTIYSVQDNGAGFDMQYVNKLFGVFQRLHSNKEFEGTGVGLAIVQRIVERHGGQVWAKGELGQGATFFVSLPNKHQAP